MTSYESDIHKLRECENKMTARIFVPKRDDKFTCFTLSTIYNNNNNYYYYNYNYNNNT